MNQAIIDQQLVPAHRDFATAAQQLADSWDLYCGQSGGELETMRSAYHDAYDQWMTISWVNFGPQSLFMRPIRIHFWPDERNTLGRQLSGVLQEPRDDLLDPETLATASVALQGLPALERLLYADVGQVDDTYACQLAVSIAENIQSIADGLSQSWSDLGGRALTMPEGQALTVTLFQTVYEQLELIVQRKLLPALGDSPDAARPRLAENWRSGRALRNITANLIAIRGVLENGDDLGFADLLRSPLDRADIGNAVVDELNAAIALAERLQDRPIDRLVTDPDTRAELVALVDHVTTIKQIWADEVGPALGLNLGFNSLDGD